jgi:flagellin-like hook-associated protein FlgL
MDARRILQGSDAADLLTDLDSLAEAVEAGDTAGSDAGMAALDRAFARVSVALSHVGHDQVGVEESAARLRDQRTASEARLAGHENVDMAEAITRMTNARTAYEAALAAVGARSQRSLLDYLR